MKKFGVPRFLTWRAVIIPGMKSNKSLNKKVMPAKIFLLSLQV
jgi:hypothetical protein